MCNCGKGIVRTAQEHQVRNTSISTPTSTHKSPVVNNTICGHLYESLNELDKQVVMCFQNSTGDLKVNLKYANKELRNIINNLSVKCPDENIISAIEILVDNAKNKISSNTIT